MSRRSGCMSRWGFQCLVSGRIFMKNRQKMPILWHANSSLWRSVPVIRIMTLYDRVCDKITEYNRRTGNEGTHNIGM